MEFFLLFLFLILAIWISVKVASGADAKGRSMTPFFWLSLLLFPLGAIIAGVIIAGVKPLSSEEQKAFQREEFEKMRPNLPKSLGGPMDNRIKFGVEKLIEEWGMPPEQVQNHSEWQDPVLEKMVELGSITPKELEKAVSLKGSGPVQVEKKFRKLKRKSSVFAAFVADLDAELDSKISTDKKQDPVGEPLVVAQNTSPAQASEGDLAASIERLSALKNSGVLTEEEFAQAKKKLLHE
jgi:hypothetical protein